MIFPLGKPEPEIIQGPAAEEFLTERGLSRELLVEAISGGIREMRSTDRNYPRTAAGYYLWAAIIGGLRRSLMETGEWERDDPKNRPLIINKSSGMAITASGGDANTGTANPSNVARKKGSATKESYTSGQIVLFDMSPEEELATKNAWILLYRVTNQGVQAELSLPTGFDDDGFVESWRTRVLIDVRDDFDSLIAELPTDLAGGDVEFSLMEG